VSVPDREQEHERERPRASDEVTRRTRAQQVALFPETNPLLDELKDIDVNSLSPIEALNKLNEIKKMIGLK